MPSTTLKLRPFVAPRRFVFKDPDTGFEFEEDTQTKLFARILSYRGQNRLPEIEALSTVVEAYWCTLPENLGSCRAVPLKRGWYQYLKGGIALFQNLVYNSMVSQEEAERRAAICLGCKYNVFPDKGNYARWADELAEASTKGRRVSVHEKLGNCEVCSCNMRAKVFYAGPISPSAEERVKMREVKCWQLSANTKTTIQNL